MLGRLQGALISAQKGEHSPGNGAEYTYFRMLATPLDPSSVFLSGHLSRRQSLQNCHQKAVSRMRCGGLRDRCLMHVHR